MVVLAFTRPASVGILRIDALSALKSALASGKASFWQSGPLATQARVEVPVEGTSMRLIFDITAFQGGGMSVDVQFANDRAMEATGGRVGYTATVVMDGRQVAHETVDAHLQYQSWHREFATGADGGQGLGSPAAGWLNIRQDIAELSRIGAIADYDPTIPVSQEMLGRYAETMAQPGWEAPLSANGVAKWMPVAGGRPDIGITTMHNTVWLMSQDPRAAAYALGQADAGVPWRYWDAANDTWLNAGDYPKLWVLGREGGVTGTAGNPNTTSPTQFDEFTGYDGWAPESAHQPDLYFVPYVMTGERWILDNLLAQAAWNTVFNWPDGHRLNTVTGAYDLVVKDVQVRAAAWSLRQIENAAWAAPEGSQERTYFRHVADENWKWILAQIPTWTEQQGEAHGYLPNGMSNGRLGPWQQDYFASTAISAASRGSAEALAVLNWMKNFLVGRFLQAPEAFNPRDGALPALVAGPEGANGGVGVYKTWAEIGAATIAAGYANSTGPDWPRNVNNDYAQSALATLAGIWFLTGDASAKAAYERFAALNPPWADLQAFSGTYRWNVTIPGIYSGTSATQTRRR